MKRLLLPLLAALALPTAVNAFPWGSDIVVKTVVGDILKTTHLPFSVFRCYTSKTYTI